MPETMTTVRTRIASVIAIAILAIASFARAQPTEAVWDAGSGLTPEQSCPAWMLTDDAPGADPVLANGVLTLSTAANAEDMFYTQGIPLPAPDPIVIEARVQLSSGSSSFDNRGPVAVGVTTSPNTGAFLFLDAGQMFLTADGDVRGASASVDTEGAPHTYRMEVTAAGFVTVAYDGTTKLAGHTFMNAAAFGPTPRVLWGEGSVLAFGTEAWTSLRHNAAACGGATTTTVVTSSTTTSTLPGACDDVTPGSSEALRCRLGILATRIDSKAGLGTFRQKLSPNAARAVTLAGEADGACADGDTKTASRRMKQVQKQLQKMAQRLHGLAARKQLDGGVRADLITVIGSIRTDVAALRKKPCA